MKQQSQYLKKVRNQYEDYPYPRRNPEDERQRLLGPVLDGLPTLNHYCFGGGKDFSGAAVLVAGGGTGDATVFLAEQLAPLGGHVTHLDMSTASIAVAQERVRVRGLDNVTFVHESLLELPGSGLGPFDYINCAGVLHHLADPDAGLLALKSVLKDDGAMGIMLYATYGRTGVYQMQRMMRLINQNDRDIKESLKNTKAALKALPASNWFRRGAHLTDDFNRGDVGIYDLLLHSQDRAYTVDECYDFVENAGLFFAGFAYPGDRILLSPELSISSGPVRDLFAALPLREQQAAMELYAGSMIRQCFYVTALSDRCAELTDLDNVPFFYNVPQSFVDSFAQALQNANGETVEVKRPGLLVQVPPGELNVAFWKAIDGQRTLGEIYAAVGATEPAAKGLDNTALAAAFKLLYHTLNPMNLLLLRQRDMAPFASLPISS